MSIRRCDVHVCLVSDQATPNFIPVLDTRFRPLMEESEFGPPWIYWVFVRLLGDVFRRADLRAIRRTRTTQQAIS